MACYVPCMEHSFWRLERGVLLLQKHLCLWRERNLTFQATPNVRVSQCSWAGQSLGQRTTPQEGWFTISHVKNTEVIISFMRSCVFSFWAPALCAVDNGEQEFSMLPITLALPVCFCHMTICLTFMAEYVNSNSMASSLPPPGSYQDL